MKEADKSKIWDFAKSIIGSNKTLTIVSNCKISQVLKLKVESSSCVRDQYYKKTFFRPIFCLDKNLANHLDHSFQFYQDNHFMQQSHKQIKAERNYAVLK